MIRHERQAKNEAERFLVRVPRDGRTQDASAQANRQYDALFTMDNLNRLTIADEGTLSGTISNRSRKQEWTLSQPGNWAVYKMDLNGGTTPNYSDAGEYNDTETFNVANEILTRDTDSNASVNYTQVHDAVGNMTDDGKDYEYLYDVFGRLRKVKRTDNQALVAEYTYNGLNRRIGWHYDVDGDGTVESPGGSGDSWYYFAYDERWRMVATFRNDEGVPIEVFTNHAAGRGGHGGSSALDGAICRDKNLDNGWNVAAGEDETLEERVYFCQNWRGDVVAVVSSGGAQRLEARYSAYGVPSGFPAGDLDADGDCDFGDLTIIGGWIGITYDVRGDMDLDGDVDSADQTILSSLNYGVTLGRGKLSRTVTSAAGGVRKGYAGYEHDGALLNSSFMHVRNRVYMAELGRWTRRDHLGYVDGMSLYAYVAGSPICLIDLMGTLASLSDTHRGSLLDTLPNIPSVDCTGADPRTCEGKKCLGILDAIELLKSKLFAISQQEIINNAELTANLNAAQAAYDTCASDAWDTYLRQMALAAAVGAFAIIATPYTGGLSLLMLLGEGGLTIWGGNYLRLEYLNDLAACASTQATSNANAQSQHATNAALYASQREAAWEAYYRKLDAIQNEYLRCVHDRNFGAGDPGLG